MIIKTFGIGFIAFLLYVATASAETDFSVGWIQRLPKINYVWNSKNPTVEGWPKPEQEVTWVANVRNLGKSSASADYRWLLDGEIVSSGQATLEANKITTFKFPWKWNRTRHKLVFEIDPANAIKETEERNNSLLIYSDALTVGFWVEQTFWETIQETLKRAEIGCTTFEDWMQSRIRQFNEMAELAIYPETPKGVLDRWRIDEIHIVADGALPISSVPDEGTFGVDPQKYGIPFPDSKDRSIDMQWGYPSFTIDWFKNNDAWPLLYDSLVHELGHARYLIDVYAWSVSAQNDAIGINPAPPSSQYGWYHVNPEHGLMNTSYGFIDRYSAVALNRIAGRRAILGNYNEPQNIGSFLNDLPAENRIVLQTPDGKTFPNKRVRIYRASGKKDPDWASHVYQLKIDNKPDLEFVTDSNGTILVGRNPFSRDKLISGINEINTLAIVELIDGKKSHWGYLESREFNLAYWRGEIEFATHKLIVDAPICFSPGIGPDRVWPRHRQLVTESPVSFEWPASPPQPYQLWYSVDGAKSIRVDVPADPHFDRMHIEIPISGKHVAWWLVYKNPSSPPECPPVRSSTFFFDLAM
jgi:CARDB